MALEFLSRQMRRLTPGGPDVINGVLVFLETGVLDIPREFKRQIPEHLGKFVIGVDGQRLALRTYEMNGNPPLPILRMMLVSFDFLRDGQTPGPPVRIDTNPARVTRGHFGYSIPAWGSSAADEMADLFDYVRDGARIRRESEVKETIDGQFREI